MASYSPDPAASGLISPPAPIPGRKLTTIDLIGGIYCHICKLVLGNKKKFDSHYLQHDTGTEVITYTCVACHLASNSYPSFRGHCYTSHVIKNRFKCNTCNKAFSKLSVLKEHIECTHNFRCNKPDCNLQFLSKKELHLHQVVHKDDANKPPYKCQTCGDQFENIQICEDHIDKHCIFTYSCPLCHENLTKENAPQHLINHYGVENNDATDLEVEETPEDSSINIVGGILCKYCRQLFKNRLEIDTHIVEEHPDKEIIYTCIICHKHYEKYSLYGDHCYYHFSKNRHVCDVCNKSFSRLSLLVAHANLHKTGGQDDQSQEGKPQHEIRCRLCNLVLTDAYAALRHLSVHRRTQYSCPVCARKYSEKYLLMKHAPQHFEAVFHMCKICGKVFAAKNRLIEHVKTHSSVKSYECKFCGKGFLKPYQLSQHLNVHTGARPYVCVACPKTFASLPNWQKHVRRMHNIDPKTVNKPVQCDIDSKTDITIEEEAVIRNDPDITTKEEIHTKDPYNYYETNITLVEEPIIRQERNKSISRKEPIPVIAASVMKKEQKSEMIEYNKHAEGTEKTFIFCDEIMEPETIDSTVVEREAKRYEIELKSMNASDDCIAELTPILPEDIDKFVSDMLSEAPANIPREYGPDFGPEDAPLAHVAPQLVAGPPYGAPPPSWEPPVITKVCSGYYGDLEEVALSFIDTDIF